jgi:hypothetical protein
VHPSARHRRAFGVARLIFEDGDGASLLGFQHRVLPQPMLGNARMRPRRHRLILTAMGIDGKAGQV